MSFIPLLVRGSSAPFQKCTNTLCHILCCFCFQRRVSLLSPLPLKMLYVLLIFSLSTGSVPPLGHWRAFETHATLCTFLRSHLSYGDTYCQPSSWLALRFLLDISCSISPRFPPCTTASWAPIYPTHLGSQFSSNSITLTTPSISVFVLLPNLSRRTVHFWRYWLFSRYGYHESVSFNADRF